MLFEVKKQTINIRNLELRDQESGVRSQEQNASVA